MGMEEKIKSESGLLGEEDLECGYHRRQGGPPLPHQEDICLNHGISTVLYVRIVFFVFFSIIVALWKTRARFAHRQTGWWESVNRDFKKARTLGNVQSFSLFFLTVGLEW